MSLNPVKVIVIEGASGGSLRERSHLNKLIHGDDLQFQIISATPSNKVSQTVNENDFAEILLKLSEEDHISAGTLRQRLEESPNSALFVRIDKNNQEFFNWILKSGSEEELLKNRQYNFFKPQEEKIELEEVSGKDLIASTILEEVSDAIYIKDLQGRYLVMNSAGANIIGKPIEEIIGRDDTELLSPEAAKNIMEADRRVIRSGNQETYEFNVTAGGVTRAILTRKKPFHDSRGNVIGVIGISLDITDRKQMEETLHQTNQTLQQLIQANPLATMILDAEGTVRMWSPAAERIFGWKEKEVVGCFLPVVADDQRQEFLKNIQSVIKGRRIMALEVQHQRKGGIPVEVSVWGVPLSDSDGKRQGLFVVADITEKRKMEEAILRVQKLESLGILAGGLAHDFNNIMTAVLGNISMARLTINEPKKLRIMINEAEKATVRAINLTQQLLMFAKGGGPVKKLTSIGELVKESAGFALRGSNVRFEYTLQNDLWTVEIDEGQISQVIHNLVFNAQQEAPAGGTLHIKVENIEIESENRTGLKKGPYIRISVKDFGLGSSKENILKVFDPDYMAGQKGSPLRFASACSIVRRHGGAITVDTEKEITLFIYLPAIPADASSRLTITEKSMEES